MKNPSASPKGGPAHHTHHATHRAAKFGVSHYLQNPYAVPVLVIGLAIGLLIGINTKSSPRYSSHSSGSNQPSLKNPQSPSTATKIIYEVTAEDDRFNPSEIHANLGDIVSLFIYAKDKIYEVVVPAFGLEKIIYPNDKKFIEFQAEKPGRYTFSCKTCSGSAQGVVIVENK